MIYCIFYQVNLSGSGLFIKKIGYLLDKKCNKITFYYLKNSKIPKVSSSGNGLKRSLRTLANYTELGTCGIFKFVQL